MGAKRPILIGPTGVGKSTVGRLLAERMKLPLVSLDEVRFGYYAEMDYDEAHAAELRAKDYEGLLRYWEPFNAHAVERALAEHAVGVFDFGAIHSVYDDPALFGRVQSALEPEPHVVLLLPSPDPQASVKTLHDRGQIGATFTEDRLAMWWRIIERFVSSPCNALLAKQTVYTDGLSAEEVAQTVVQRITDDGRPDG